MYEQIIEKQKGVADKVLASVEKFDPTCVVAGGAPRDWHFGRGASDIDLFFHFRPNSTFSQVKALLERSIGVAVSQRGKDVVLEHYKRNPHLKRVFDAEVDGVKVQLMEMDKPTFGVVHDFPLSICKAWYKKGKIHLEKEFLVGEKFSAIIKTGEAYNNSDKYIKKILDKFPGYKFYGDYEDFTKRRLLLNT